MIWEHFFNKFWQTVNSVGASSGEQGDVVDHLARPNFHFHQGKYDDAGPLLKRTLAIREETLGPRHPDVASSLNNLGALMRSQVIMWH